MSTPRSLRFGVVLVGGGARAAYQAGVLHGLARILKGRLGQRPLFDVITGVSAGAINASFLASRADRMAEAAEELTALWRDIRMDRVIQTKVANLAMIGTRWIRDLSLGGLMPAGQTRSNYLLDTQPLHAFLRGHIDFRAIESHVASGALHALAVSATNYNTGTAVTFFDGQRHIQPWARSSRLGRRARLTLQHVLASAAIPILFKPVEVGGSYYGDGGIRMTTPLSPAIHLGSERVVAISIRHKRTDQHTQNLNQDTARSPEVSIADIAGVMLNAAFLDSLDDDIERMERINRTSRLLTESQRKKHPFLLREIPLLVIHPSMDLGRLAADQFKRFPSALRYVMRGIGASNERGSDLVSYLSFDPSYSRPLLEFGFRDAMAKKDEIESFYFDGKPDSTA